MYINVGNVGLFICINTELCKNILSNISMVYPDIIHSVTQWHAASTLFASIDLKTLFITSVFLKPENVTFLNDSLGLSSLILYCLSIL